ncbi:MAG: protein kinase [Bifidobacteriaceae bacterium]|jgi:serine/threonine-protein kinase|nr:protein kinase [Bifidobacteriaceae bacterium]
MIAQSGLTLADGRYRLVSRIAVGGMGEVWRAHDTHTDMPVAVKVLRSEFTGDQTSLQRLRIEAQNASSLNHPNITTVHDYREYEGTGYLVMEYVDGQSLADVLAAHATIAPLRLLPILIQASLGLHAAHSAGVVHRDVKPGNILLGPSDHVKLTDFGISVAQGQLALTDTGKVMGTAQYLAPEQALGNPATPAGDLYSLGVIAYEALAGRRPFRGANYVAIALAQVNDDPPPLPSSVEGSLAALVMQLLDKDPAYRPPTGAQLAGLLSEVLETHRQLAGRLLGSPVSRTTGSLVRPPGRAAARDLDHTAESHSVPTSALMPPTVPADLQSLPQGPAWGAAEPMGDPRSAPAYPPAEPRLMSPVPMQPIVRDPTPAEPILMAPVPLEPILPAPVPAQPAPRPPTDRDQTKNAPKRQDWGPDEDWEEAGDWQRVQTTPPDQEWDQDRPHSLRPGAQQRQDWGPDEDWEQPGDLDHQEDRDQEIGPRYPAPQADHRDTDQALVRGQRRAGPPRRPTMPLPPVAEPDYPGYPLPSASELSLAVSSFDNPGESGSGGRRGSGRRILGRRIRWGWILAVVAVAAAAAIVTVIVMSVWETEHDDQEPLQFSKPYWVVEVTTRVEQ